MKHATSLSLVFSFAYLLSVLPLFGTGFSLMEMSSRGNARQGTIVGTTKDASAIFFNPANMTELPEGHVHSMVGVTLARPDYDTRVAGVSTDQEASIFPLPHFYLVDSVSDRLALGLGIYTEYGLGTCYEGREDWPLAQDSTRTKITSFTFAPSAAYQLTDTLSLGASLRVMYLNLLSDRYLPDYHSIFHLDTEDWTLAYQLALSWQATDTLRFGLVYRSESNFSESGDVTLPQLNLQTGVSGDITMPQNVAAGLNWQATQRLNLGTAVIWTDWSCLDELAMHFDSLLPDMSAPKNWKAALRYSIGAEYAVNDRWSVLCGYSYDNGCYRTSSPDTLCPQGDREQYGLGLSYAEGPWRISVNYMLVKIHETDLQFGPLTAQFRNLRTDTFGVSYEYSF